MDKQVISPKSCFLIVVFVVWGVEIVWFSFSEGLRILGGKPDVREETDFSKWQKLLDVMRYFFKWFENDVCVKRNYFFRRFLIIH